MRRIEKINQVTDNRFLNMYTLEMKSEENKKSTYYVASRAKNINELKITTKRNKADGVIIYSLYYDQDNKCEKVVLIRQYRCPIDDYIYEFPAGLVDEGEDFKTAGIRELKEETGLILSPIDVKDMFTKPFFTTVGMTDESCGTVYGYAKGKPSKEGQEENEEIEIVLADRKEARRILEEENVSIMCAYMLMHFLHTAEGKVFDFLEAI
ncbi:NUDIX hydrolase [Faecalimonas sp.]